MMLAGILERSWRRRVSTIVTNAGKLLIDRIRKSSISGMISPFAVANVTRNGMEERATMVFLRKLLLSLCQRASINFEALLFCQH